MLLSLLVGFNLCDRFPLSIALCSLHLLLAENKNSLLLFVLGFDLVLHVCDELLNVGIRVLELLIELLEALDLFVVFKGLAALNEEVGHGENVGLFQLLVLILEIGVVPLLLVVDLGGFKLILKVALSLLLFLLLNQLVIEVLELAEVGDDAALVLFVALLLELVLVDFEHF